MLISPPPLPENHQKTALQHECDQCGKKFKRKHNLKNHSVVHTGLKKFKCLQCDKSFKQIGHLKAHSEEVHQAGSEKENCVCNLCQKYFKSERKLKYHQKHTHSVRKKHSCLTCGKEFSRGKLKQHILRDHEKSFPYNCPYCRRKFVSNYYLKRHIRSNHPCPSHST